MAKDPFNIPPIQPSEQSSASAGPSNFVEESQNLTKGSAPKNILANIQKVAVPLAAVSILAWVMMPDNRATRKKPDEPEAVVDRAVQVSNTSALLDQLKDEAKKAPTPQATVDPKATPSAPGAAGGYAGGTAGQMPTPMAPQAGYPLTGHGTSPEMEAQNQALLAKQKREEDVRASPLEAQGTFTLVSESASAPAKSNVSQLQDEMARLVAAQDSASAGLRNDTNKALEAMARQPTVQSGKNPNQEFLNSQAASGSTVRTTTAQAAPASFMVFEGTTIRSVLLPEVSSDMPGKITAQVTADVYDSIHMKYVLIPRGSRLIGVYNNEVAVGQERTLVAMTRLIFPDGSSVSLGGASASDMMGKSGLKADVNNHFWKMFSSSFIIGASSFFLGDKRSTVTTTNNGAGNTTTGSVAGMALSDVLQTLMNRNKNIPPTLTNEYGQEFIFMTTQDMALNPYRR